MNALTDFRSAMQQRGLVPPPEILADGKLHRCDVQGKNGSGDGAYVFHDDERPAGGFQNWQDGQDWQSWTYINGRGPLTAEERSAMAVKFEAAKRAAAIEAEKRRDEAAERAAEIWESASPAETHTYLDRKQIRPHGARIYNDALVIPITNEKGKLRSLQFINADGNKRFLSGGEIRASYFSIGKPSDVLCIGEGFATMATVHEATGLSCAIAFDCGNLDAVAKALRAKFPDAKLILCADDDHKTSGNPGLVKGSAAARTVNGLVAKPLFPAGRGDGDTDFNDLALCSGIDAVRACIEAASIETNAIPSAKPEPLLSDSEYWGEIDISLLEGARGDIPEFPVHVLPPAWSQWVSETAESAGAPADYVAQGLLASVAAISGAGIVAEVNPGWHEPLVLWLALVGVPSSGKSPALAASRRLIEPIELEMRAGDAERQRAHDTNVEQARLLSEKWKLECEAALDRGVPAPIKPVEAVFDENFIASQIVVADATIEALVDVVHGNPRGVVLWRDELAAWLGNLGRYSNGNDRPQYLEAWAAASVTINRKSRRGPLHLGRFPVSIIGTIQPDRIAEALAGADDGMAARFCYVWPDPPKYRSILSCRPSDNVGAQARLRRIAGISGTADQPRVLQLAPDAQVLLDAFLSELHAESLSQEGLEAGFLGKGRGTVVRLAAALTLLRWSETEAIHAPSTIDAEAMGDAAGLWADYMRPHAQAVFNRSGASGRDKYIRRTVRWLRASKVEELSREDVRCVALGRGVDAEGADQIIARLVSGNVLREVRSPSGAKRGRPALRWSVNPALFAAQVANHA